MSAGLIEKSPAKVQKGRLPPREDLRLDRMGETEEDADMTHDAGHELKSRLRSDLRVAIKGGRTGEARLIRALVAAIDDAEAPPPRTADSATGQHRFREGTAEVERLLLDRSQVHAIVMAEIRERELAAAELDGVGRSDRADALRADASVARRYVE